MIKRLIIEVNKVARRKKCEDFAQKEAKDSCEAFQHNLSGIMFYSVPHFMTAKDIQIMLGESCIIDVLRTGSHDNPRDPSSPWQALSHEIEAINEDFEDSIAHDHTRICVISHGLIQEMKVNSLTFMLHHVLDDSHINTFC